MLLISSWISAAEKQRKPAKKPESKKSKQAPSKKGSGGSTSQTSMPAQGAPAAKPKRYSSQRQRTTQQMPLPVQQAMVPQIGAMYPDQAYYEQMGEFFLIEKINITGIWGK